MVHGSKEGSTTVSDKKSKTPSCLSRGEPVEEANIMLSEEAKKLLKRKVRLDDLIDNKGVKNLKADVDPADISTASMIGVIMRYRG